jgi:hypothetical protein
MDTPNPNPGPTPLESADGEHYLAALTGMSVDSAKTFMDFHSGSRWLRKDPA